MATGIGQRDFLRRPTHVVLAAAVLAVATAAAAGRDGDPPAAEGPFYFVAIHNEPFHGERADLRLPEAYDVLRRMVARADGRRIRLTLMFSPPWADFLLATPDRRREFEAWKAAGHEISAHHHSIHHGNWDGYTAYPWDEAMAVRRRHRPVPEDYVGTLDDFMRRVRALNPAMRSGCLNDESDKRCLPDAILVDTASGFANFGEPGGRLDDTVPEKGRNDYISVGAVNGVERRWLCHYQATTPERVRLARLVAGAMSRGVYGTVNHSSREEEESYNAWIDWLRDRDPGGRRSVSLSEIVDRKLLPEKTIPAAALARPAADAYGPARATVPPPDLQALIDRCNDLVRRRRDAGRDVSGAVARDRDSREAFAAGDVERCRRLLEESVGMLEADSP